VGVEFVAQVRDHAFAKQRYEEETGCGPHCQQQRHHEQQQKGTVDAACAAAAEAIVDHRAERDWQTQ
jgi:hypothetical protein